MRRSHKPYRPAVFWPAAGFVQRQSGFAVEALSAAQEKAQGAALAINPRMDFCRAATLTCAPWSLPLFYPVLNGAL
jgi:hypothetical protein